MGLINDLNHLHEHSRSVALLPAEERIAWIRRERWIEYPRGMRALDRISDLLAHPPRDRMPCLLLHGATGMGKTRILQKFLRSHTPIFDETTGFTRLAVAAIQMPPHPNELHLYEEILVSLGAALPYSPSTGTLRHRVRVLCRQMNVRMLIIDEIHCLLAGTYREQRIILNCIRFLANDLRIPLVCAGTQEARTALLTDEQLADRFEAFELAPWQDDTDFHQLLVSYAALLPLRRPSTLRDAKVRKRLLAMTDGVTVRICRILEDAAIMAINQNIEQIDLDSLHDGLAVQSLASVSDRRKRRTTGPRG
jgi:hypothetical protein